MFLRLQNHSQDGAKARAPADLNFFMTTNLLVNRALSQRSIKIVTLRPNLTNPTVLTWHRAIFDYFLCWRRLFQGENLTVAKMRDPLSTGAPSPWLKQRSRQRSKSGLRDYESVYQLMGKSLNNRVDFYISRIPTWENKCQATKYLGQPSYVYGVINWFKN